MKEWQERAFAQPGLYLGLLFLVISAQLFWWLLFFAEIRFALVHVQDERDRILEMALNGDPGLSAPPYMEYRDGRYVVDPDVVAARRHERDRNVVMLVAEASFFLAVFGIVSIFLMRLYRSERNMAKEQELFLNSFTHELKTPLAAIKLNLQTLKRRPDHSRTAELVDGSLREVEILNRRISEILLGGELSSEQKTAEMNGTGEGTDVFSVLERTVLELQSLIKERQAVIDVGWLPPVKGRLRSLLPSGKTIPEPVILKRINENGSLVREALQTLQLLEERRLHIEARELGSVLTELISNALLYATPPVHLQILLRQKGRWLQMYFIDDGPGIPYSERKNIFRPMVRLQRNGFVPGTGMGLANVKAMLKRRHGCINLLPSQKGARFLVEILFRSHG